MNEASKTAIVTKSPTFSLRVLAEIVVVAVIYFVTAKIGQIFAIPPGNITPVWLPSGIVLALLIIRGTYLWPGVFIGAFAGNVSAYIDLTTTSGVLGAIFSGTFNGIGDVLSTLLPILVMKRLLNSTNPFRTLQHYWYFLWSAVLVGPLISAFMGTTSLAIVSLLSWTDYQTAFFTWWVGDAVGVLIIAPAILIFKYESNFKRKKVNLTEMIAFLVTASCLSYLIMQAEYIENILPSANYLMIPLLFWALIRLDEKTVFISILLYTGVTVYATSLNIGPFTAETQQQALIQMQGFITMLTVSIFIVATLLNERGRLLIKLEDKVSHDLLTNARSRSYFEEQLKKEIFRFDRNEIPFSLIMFDIDRFKEINDTYGHLIGDEILVAIAREASNNLRQTDTLARWGGEEFMVLLPGANIKGAESTAESLRKRIEKNEFVKHIKLTISLSVHEFHKGIGYSDFLSQLDKGLYKSKNLGRNRTTVVHLSSPVVEHT